MAASSDGYVFFRTAVGSDLTTQTTLAASGATGVTVATVRNSLSHVNVQRLRYIPRTYATGALTFTEADATGPIIGVFTLPAAGPTAYGEQDLFLDFGPKGWKMAVGTSLFLTRSTATGPSGAIVVEAYGTSSTGPLAIATTN